MRLTSTSMIALSRSEKLTPHRGRMPSLAAVSVLVILAGCQSGGFDNAGLTSPGVSPPPGSTATPPPVTETAPVASVEGFWEPMSGAVTYKTQFKDGQFLTRSNEGNLILAKGQFSSQTDGTVRMQWVSGAFKETVTADCVRPTPDQMTCTPSRGSPFSLRRAAT
ncbi:MAG: hypothetical protein AAFO73_06190, partial [Pseudomonadota bacterium]